jgi:hypothetical protein
LCNNRSIDFSKHTLRVRKSKPITCFNLDYSMNWMSLDHKAMVPKKFQHELFAVLGDLARFNWICRYQFKDL